MFPEVELHRVLADPEPCRDLAIAEPVDDERQDLPLPGREARAILGWRPGAGALGERRMIRDAVVGAIAASPRATASSIDRRSFASRLLSR